MINYTLLDELKKKERVSYYDFFRALGTETVTYKDIYKVLEEISPQGDCMPRIFYDNKQDTDNDSFIELLRDIGTAGLRTPSDMNVFLEEYFNYTNLEDYDDYLELHNIFRSILYLAHVVALAFYESEPEVISYNAIFEDVFNHLFDSTLPCQERTADFYKLLAEVHGIACDAATDSYLASLNALVSACKEVRKDRNVFYKIKNNAKSLRYFCDERFMLLLELHLGGMSLRDVVSEFKKTFNFRGLCVGVLETKDEDLLPLSRLRPMQIEHLIDEAYADMVNMKCPLYESLDKINLYKNLLEEEYMKKGGIFD